MFHYMTSKCFFSFFLSNQLIKFFFVDAIMSHYVSANENQFKSLLTNHEVCLEKNARELFVEKAIRRIGQMVHYS